MSDTSIKSKDDIKVGRPSMYKVIFHNDNYTSAEFVASMLQKHFGKTKSQADAITTVIHKGNKGVAGTYTKDIAETKATQVKTEARTQGFPLKITVEQE